METAMNKSPASSQSGQKIDQRAGKYLSFRVAKEDFAIDVHNVREIMGIQEITAVPQSPVYVKGVMNLRGKAIPVIDLRLKFGLPDTEYTPRTCIVVVQVETMDGQILMGTIVDGVSEVLNLQSADIANTPDFGDGTAAPYILGMAKIKGKVKILLDINMLLT